MTRVDEFRGLATAVWEDLGYEPPLIAESVAGYLGLKAKRHRDGSVDVYFDRSSFLPVDEDPPGWQGPFDAWLLEKVWM